MMNIFARITGRLERMRIRGMIWVFNFRKSVTGTSSLLSKLNVNGPVTGFESIYAQNKRGIEILHSDMELEEAIFSIYFISKADPQVGIVRGTPDIAYIAPWYNSIGKIGVTGIILHDGIDADFIAAHQTNKILFRKYTPGLYSTFEERWFAYYMFLSKSNIKKAFFSDINDVYITKNPLPLIKEDTLYIGKDNANKIKDSGWMLDELKAFEEDSKTKAPSLYPYQYAYNAGIVGGVRNVMLFLMSKVISHTLLTRTGTHKDMTILNLCIYKYFTQRIDTDLFNSQLTSPKDDEQATNKHLVTGYPLNSEFKKFQTSSDAYFIHK